MPSSVSGTLGLPPSGQMGWSRKDHEVNITLTERCSIYFVRSLHRVCRSGKKQKISFYGNDILVVVFFFNVWWLFMLINIRYLSKVYNHIRHIKGTAKSYSKEAHLSLFYQVFLKRT